MKVTYLEHSGFLLEWEHSYWIFDYYKGNIPALDPGKDIVVFSSHSHDDHFTLDIFSIFADRPDTTYVFSDEILEAYEEFPVKAHILGNRTDTSITTPSGELLKIHTLQSTDLGCAFFIEYNGKTIYHAGDLHWWYWEGEDPAWNDQMTTNFKNEVEFLKNKQIDLAFSPLDPRQEKDYALGMNYILENTNTRHMFPMHFWGKFNITEQYTKEYPIPDHTCFYVLKQNGQSFEIML